MFDTIGQTLQTLALTYGLNLLWAIIIFLVGRWAAKVISQWLRNWLTRIEVDASLIGFAAHLTYFGIIAFAVLAALQRLGVQTASFIAVLGAAGLAVGLALQGSLSNFAAKVFPFPSLNGMCIFISIDEKAGVRD